MTILISIGILLALYLLFKIIEFLIDNPPLFISTSVVILFSFIMFIVYQARGGW